MLKALSMFGSSPRIVTLVSDTILQHTKASALLRLTSCHIPRVRVRQASTESGLLKMPVPPLQQSLDTYLKSIRPLVTEEEFCVTQEIVKKFAGCDGVGTKLQKLLEERARCTENWLSEWWLNVAYLGFRMPVVVFSNPGLIFPSQNQKGQEEQICLAAKIISAALDFKKTVDENKIPQEKMGKDNLDMAQYSKVLGTCRIPGIPLDSLSFEDKCNKSKHVTVICNNHFFELPVYGEGCGGLVPLSDDQLICGLKEIVKSSCPETDPIGILTTENRDTWAKAYESLAADPENARSLCSIQKSLFVLCLDKPSSSACGGDKLTDVALEMVHGSGSKVNSSNRWFDKTVQFIIGTSGELGLTYEHSPAEGPPISYLMDHIIKLLEKGGVKNKPAGAFDQAKKLTFNFPSCLCPTLQTAKKNLDKLVADLEMVPYTYCKYGKEFPKSQKLSPDSYIQIAIQLAFYRLHKLPGAHYESASTRKFLHGRTETIRSCSCESVNFARLALEGCASNSEKEQALRAAVKAHKDYTIMAVNGNGIDRHFLGLKLIASENGIEIPPFFKDTSFVRSSHLRISSSQVAAKCEAFMCYAPLVPDGYGCCYNPRANEIIMGISAFRSNSETSAVKFRDALQESLDDMHEILNQSPKCDKSKSKM